MLDAVWLIPALPLAGFAIILVFGRRLGEPKAGYVATLMIFIWVVNMLGFIPLPLSNERFTVPAEPCAQLVDRFRSFLHTSQRLIVQQHRDAVAGQPQQVRGDRVPAVALGGIGRRARLTQTASAA